MKSLWDKKPIKDSIKHSDVDKKIFFPPMFKPLLDTFDQTVRNSLQATKTKVRKNGGGGEINKTRMRSTTRQYRIAASLSFMVNFWSEPVNTHIQLTSVDMTKWIIRYFDFVSQDQDKPDSSHSHLLKSR